MTMPFCSASSRTGVIGGPLLFGLSPEKLSLVERDDPMTQMIAKKIIEVGQRGVLDAQQISSIAIKELGL